MAWWTTWSTLHFTRAPVHPHPQRNLKLVLKEQELANQDIVRQLKLEHAKEITKLRQEFELQVRAVGVRAR